MPNDLSPLLADTLAGANAAGRIRVAGLGGKRAFLDAHLDAPEFELIEAPFNLRSDWDDRNRVKRAVARGMTVIGCDYYPALQIARRDAGTEPRQGLLRFGLGGKERSLEQSSTYAFLSLYQGWTAEEICLAYALTEPGLSSIHISAAGVRNLPALAAAPEREMPTGVPAQIEMARIQAS